MFFQNNDISPRGVKGAKGYRGPEGPQVGDVAVGIKGGAKAKPYIAIRSGSQNSQATRIAPRTIGEH